MTTPRAFNARALAKSISVTTTASSSTALPAAGSTLRICNTGLEHAYIHITTGTAVATVPTGTAAATCTPVMAGTDIVLGLTTGDTLNISAITSSGSTTLVIQVGEGV